MRILRLDLLPVDVSSSRPGFLRVRSAISIVTIFMIRITSSGTD